MKTSPLLDAALAYASRGWPVFPCHHPCSGSCSCRSMECSSVGKHPRTRRGLHEATTDRATIERWWRAWPRANVAIRTGAEGSGASGVVVVDVDPRHGGDESLDALLSIRGPLPPTGVVHTGSGGLHLYFGHPGQPVRNSAGTRLGPGLDVRGDGGYVIAPPSVHANGAAYEWTWVAEPVALPGWLAERLVTPPRPTVTPVAPPRLDPGVSAWASAALAGELERIAATPEGGRNHALNRSAFVLGQLVGGRHLDRDRAAEALEQAGQDAGLGAHEVRATVRSGLAAGEALPRHPAQRSITSSSQPSAALANGEANGLDLGRCDLPQAASRVPLPEDAGRPRNGIDLGWPA